MILSTHRETPTSQLATVNKTSFVSIIVEVRSFTVWKLCTLIKNVRSLRNRTIQILCALEFVRCMFPQYQAHHIHSKVGVCKMHTPVSTPAFVFDAMDEMLSETVLQNLDKMIGYVLLLLSHCSGNIQMFKIKQINKNSDLTLITKKLRRNHPLSIIFSQ